MPFEVLQDEKCRSDHLLLIQYGMEPEGQKGPHILFIPRFPHERQNMGSPSAFITFQGESIPLYGTWEIPPDGLPLVRYESGEPAITKSGRTIRLGFDIVASMFHLLTLEGERKGVQDEQAIQQPVIDLYICVLKSLIEQCLLKQGQPMVSKCLWPDGKRFAVFLSHDVDAVHRREPFTIAVDLYRIVKAFVRGNVHKALGDARTLCHLLFDDHDVYWNFDRWMELESRYNIRSSFYFLEGRRLARYGRRYNAVTLKPVIQRLRDGGWEVGLHGSYAAWRDARQLKRERRALEKVAEVRIQGHRQHYLHFDSEASYQCYEETGLEYDSTLGYNHQIGYRAGTSLPFHPYNRATGKKFHLLEIPLTVMDQAFLVDRIPTNALDKMLTRTAANGGLFSLLWHQRTFAQKALYGHVVQYALQQDGWIATGAQVNTWWRAREACTYVYQYNAQADTLQITVSSACPKGLCFKIRSPREENWVVPCQPGRQILNGMHIIIEMT